MGNIRDQTPPTTPERVRNEAQRNERDQRVLESPEYHRSPHQVRMARLGASVPPPPFDVPPPAPVYRNLPPDLARMYAALPPLQPTRRASVAPQLAPAFVPLPPVTHYQHLSSDLAQQLAALPPLIPQGRGRGRGRGRGNNTAIPAPVPAPAPARLTYAQIVAQYDTLQHVCFYFIVISKICFI